MEIRQKQVFNNSKRIHHRMGQWKSFHLTRATGFSGLLKETSGSSAQSGALVHLVEMSSRVLQFVALFGTNTNYDTNKRQQYYASLS